MYRCYVIIYSNDLLTFFLNNLIIDYIFRRISRAIFLSHLLDFIEHHLSIKTIVRHEEME